MGIETRNGDRTPTRPPLEWHLDSFWSEERLFAELERVFDICHGCRRCADLCPAFSTLFELVDESSSLSLENVEKQDYWRVVECCYLCDRCYATRCPYIPPHEYQVDFALLMLRAKAVQLRKRRGGTLGERLLAAPDVVGDLAAVPLVGPLLCASIDNPLSRWLLRVPSGRRLVGCQRNTLRRRLERRQKGRSHPVSSLPADEERVALFATCHGNYSHPEIGEHLKAILEHNHVPMALVDGERCCGLASLERGDLDGVEVAKRFNVPRLAEWVERGWDVLVPQPSCLQLFRRWLPALFPDDPQVHRVKTAVRDPFEYLMALHAKGRLKTDFRHALGVVALHLSCRLQMDDGDATRRLLSLVPDTYVEVVEGCIGGGMGACEASRRKPIVEGMRQLMPDHCSSNCLIAGDEIEAWLEEEGRMRHPLELMRMAYGI